MESIIELVLYCLLWVLMQGVLYVVLYYLSISYENVCIRALFDNSKMLCYLLGALFAGGLCIVKKRSFFSGMSDIPLFGKDGFLNMFILQGILLLATIYAVELGLRTFLLFARDHSIKHNALGIEFMKGKICISELIMSFLIAPFWEEILFRGLLYERLLDHTTRVSAIIIVGIVFGIFHLHPKKMVCAFFVSIVLSLCYVNGGIVMAMVCHSFYNILSNFYITIKKEKANETE